ncbi:hypothetical protein ABNB86_19145, partial [Paenibacillus larvae]
AMNMAPFIFWNLAFYTIIRTQLALMGVIFLKIYVLGLVFFILYWRDIKESLFRCLLAGLFFPVYNTLQLSAVVFAIIKQWFGNRGW